MTSISISQIISDRERRGQLIKLIPSSPLDLEVRALYLTENLEKEIRNPRTTDADIERFAYLEADLEAFVIEPQLSPDYLWRLRPRECGVWEIRSYDDDDSRVIRVFGMFPKFNCLIATHFEYRAVLEEGGDAAWNYNIRRAQGIVRNLIHPYPALTSIKADKVISGAINEAYFQDK